MDVASAPAPPDLPPPPGNPGPPRPPADRILGGVAGLLAARLGLDPLWVRLAFVLLALVGGLGLVVYLGLWLTLVVGAGPEHSAARYAGGAVILVGVPLLVGSDSLDLITGPVGVVALLMGLAVALWQPRTAPPSLARPTPGTWSAAATPARPEPAPPPPPRPPSILGRTALGVAVVVASVGAIIDQLNGGRLHPEQWLGAAAAVCGLGLLVGAFRGRARWLVLPAVAFACAGFVSGVAARVGAGWGELAGDRWIGVHRDSYTGPQDEVLAFGTVHVDIAEAPTEPAEVEARVGVGEVHVSAPRDVTVEIRARLADGEVRVDGTPQPDDRVVIGPEGPPDVIVRARVERGSVEIERYARPDDLDLAERAPAIPQLPAVPGLGQLREVADGVAATPDGWIVLLGGEAVIDPNDRVVVGASTRLDGATIAVTTSYGEYRLLPRSILLGPTGEVLDLVAVRDALADDAPATTIGTATTTPTTGD